MAAFHELFESACPKTWETIPDNNAKNNKHTCTWQIIVPHIKFQQEKEKFSAKLGHQIEQLKLLA